MSVSFNGILKELESQNLNERKYTMLLEQANWIQ